MELRNIIRVINFFVASLITIFVLVGCHTVHPTHLTSVQQSIATLQEGINDNHKLDRPRFSRVPVSVKSELFPPLSHYVTPASRGPVRFDVAANDVPARDFFMSLVSGTPYNMVVNPDVKGNITLNLKNVTLQETMDAVQDIYGYENHRTSYGYEIVAPALESQIFHINYLDVQRSGRSYVQLTTGQVSNKVGTISTGGQNNMYGGGGIQQPSTGVPAEGLGTISSIETKSVMQFWKDLQTTISNIVGNGAGRSVTVNSQAGVIVVRAYPAELHRVARYISNLQSSLNRQVILEAKIIEVQLNDSFQSGIDWGILGNNPAAIDPTTGLPSTDGGVGQSANALIEGTELTQLRGIFAIRINGSFSTLINLLQTQGNVQVLSSPHISTVNNQKAVIKVGSDEFFVTGISTSNTIIGTNTLPSQDVSLTPFFSGVTLDVTPEISSDNTVILHIHPSVSLVTQQNKTVGLGTVGTANNTLTLPLAFSTIRESDNIVRAKNGQVIVIGGLMQNNMREIIASTPWASKVPFLGWFFRRTSQVNSKSELVILLRPVVATNKNITDHLETEKETLQEFRRPFHTGALPKIFGNEAERADNN